jgi:4-aminobutyrate aminotransferase-like enzyme
MKIFEEIESEVRSYARSFPRLFNKAVGEHLYDDEGNHYLDFLAGAGALNYGHNNPVFKEKLLDYRRTGLLTDWICTQRPSVISSKRSMITFLSREDSNIS